MIGVAVVGFGYWGPNLVRNFNECPRTRVVTVCDRDPAKLARARSRFPHVGHTSDLNEVLVNPEVELVAVATPVASHHPIAKACLEAGKHVLVEKPLTMRSTDAEELLALARERGLQVFVDHTFIFSSAIRTIGQMVAAGELGDLTYYDSTRVNLGLFQSDVNVLWDLAVHDLAILDHILPVQPTAVSATGHGHVAGASENIAFMTLYYPGSFLAHINVNWLSPVKIRQTLIGGTKKMIVYNDLEPTEKLRIYDRGIVVPEADNDPVGAAETIYQLKINYRMGDILVPNLPPNEPLFDQVCHLAACLLDGETPRVPGQAGLRVVQIMEAATESMHRRGEAVPIPSESSR